MFLVTIPCLVLRHILLYVAKIPYSVLCCSVAICGHVHAAMCCLSATCGLVHYLIPPESSSGWCFGDAKSSHLDSSGHSLPVSTDWLPSLEQQMVGRSMWGFWAYMGWSLSLDLAF
ncbi:hypothetical protein B0H10DRAFT_1948388 [Mycena sp. CBHHK59/15]|nr:hypothetical protein B0H10DRAFT_1948388 [Mycena sp. CBHHK59/15]